MKKITILQVTIKNFKGIEFINIDLDIGINSFQGPNECGKSSFIDAIYWCILGENANGNKIFEYIRIGEVSCAVSVILDIDGVEYRIERIREKNKTILNINGLQYKPTQYSEWLLRNIGQKDIIRIGMNQRTFTENIRSDGGKKVKDVQRSILIRTFLPIEDMMLMSQYYERIYELNDEINELDKNVVFYYDDYKRIFELKNDVCENCPREEKVSEKMQEKRDKCSCLADRIDEAKKERDDIKRKLLDLSNKAESLINKYMDYTSFCIFQMKDGIPEPTLEIYFNGVPYKDASFSGKLICSMEITEKITSHSGLSFPIIVDNKELTYFPTDEERQYLFFECTECKCPKCNSTDVKRPVNGVSVCNSCGKEFKRVLKVVYDDE